MDSIADLGAATTPHQDDLGSCSPPDLDIQSAQLQGAPSGCNVPRSGSDPAANMSLILLFTLAAGMVGFAHVFFKLKASKVKARHLARKMPAPRIPPTLPKPKTPLQCYSTSCPSRTAVKGGSDAQSRACYSPSCTFNGTALPSTPLYAEPAKHVEIPHRERRMSMFSQLLAGKCGAFPEKSGIPPTTVYSAFYVKKLPSTADFQHMVEERILPKYHQFSSIPVILKKGETIWQPVVPFNIAPHFSFATVANETAIKEYMENLFGRPWDLTKPLWLVHFVQNATPDGLSCLIFEIHHVIGDGLSQVQILGDMVTDGKGKPMTLTDKKFSKPKQTHQHSTLKKAKQGAVMAGKVAAATVKVLSLPVIGGDPATEIKSSTKHFANKKRVIVYVPPISLQYIKDIKNKLHVTVNDVLLAALGGSIRSYLEHFESTHIVESKKQAKLRMRALLPYSFPRPLDELHNKWTMISTELPVRHETPLDRVQAAKRAMDHIKSSPEPLVATALQALAVKCFGAGMAAQTSQDMFSNHTCIFTNVPGFEHRIYLCGEPVVAVQPVVPNVLLQVSAVSYYGSVWMNFTADPDVIREPELLQQFMVQEMKALGALADLKTEEWTTGRPGGHAADAIPMF
ncbi:hypothetical protein DFS34DRAFT_683952 [Phlyctochytrium arcticum]|nr:hypothetical protein DFS34DRAFT_683952 [Phlyctochytrium arcticum]